MPWCGSRVVAVKRKTTSADFIKIPQGVVVVNFYRYNGRDKEDKEEAIQQNRKDEDENQTNDT